MTTQTTFATGSEPAPAARISRRASSRRSQNIAPDTRGLNYWDIDPSLRNLLPLYMDAGLLDHLQPHLHELGALAGGHLGALADTCERHEPVLHRRDRYGRDEEWLEFHPAYREMESIAFGRFGMHAMTNRSGVLGWPEKMPPIAKYVFHYLFSQAEFGLLCPVNLTDSSSHLVDLFGTEELRQRFLPGMWSQDMGELLKCAQFMTEKAGGSDIGRSDLTAVRDGDHWRLWGEKWFCSNVDAEAAVLLARPEGGPAGSRGLGLFLMPKTLEDGTRNDFRVMRLKEKMGSKSMASGEIMFEGAVAYQLGELDQGLKQMLVMVNSSRISHLTRAAGMMRRCWNEALAAASHRDAFGKRVIEHPLMRRQLLKLLLPTEQALTMLLYTAAASADTTPEAAKLLRILTPIVKYRACRDNVTVATGALEVRGGNGYIEDWPNSRLVRDAHLGLLWEGTSNINALDAVQRAVGKAQAHVALGADLDRRISGAGLPGQFGTRLSRAVQRAIQFAEDVAADPAHERYCREASGQLYHAASAALMATEAQKLAAAGGDARRLLLSRFIVEHRMREQGPLTLSKGNWEEEAISLLLSDRPVSWSDASRLVQA